MGPGPTAMVRAAHLEEPGGPGGVAGGGTLPGGQAGHGRTQEDGEEEKGVLQEKDLGEQSIFI